MRLDSVFSGWYYTYMQTVVFDMDGVLFRGDETMPGASDAVKTLRGMGFRTGFLTNNSTKSRSAYVDLLARHGITAVESEIMTSGEATARHLLARGLKGSRIYTLGGDGLSETLENAGFIVDTADEGDPCDIVVIGWDRQFSFNRIARAQHEILSNGAIFIATNTDPMYPAKGGDLLPGAGAMVTAVETATGSKAEVIGKPRTISLQYLLEELGYTDGDKPKSVWMVGDRLDTDIACGNAFGANTVCVTTGISSREDAENASGVLHPDFIIDSLSELPDLISR